MFKFILYTYIKYCFTKVIIIVGIRKKKLNINKTKGNNNIIKLDTNIIFLYSCTILIIHTYKRLKNLRF